MWRGHTPRELRGCNRSERALAPAGTRLLQNRNLPRMIKLMLRDPVQQVIEVVPFPRTAVGKSRVRQSGNGLNQRLVRPLRRRDSLAPRRFRRLRHPRKIRQPSRLPFLATQSAQPRLVPHGNVQHQFPNAVRFRYWSGRSRSRIYIRQQFEQPRPMPRVAIEGPPKLVGDTPCFERCSCFLNSHDS